MKIVFISNMTPYKENFHGTSALPYHLLAERDATIDVEVYSFNLNDMPDEKIREVEKELNVSVNIIPKPRWFVMMFKWHLLFLRLLLRYPLHYYLTVPERFVKEIKGLEPDGIWIYGEEMSAVARLFPEIKKVHTTVDCTSLYYHRLLNSDLLTGKVERLKARINFNKFYRLESNYLNDDTIKYHLVGEGDRDFLVGHNKGLDAHFIRHPHYEIHEGIKDHGFCEPKLKVLIAGQNNIYMAHDAKSMVESIVKEAGRLKNRCIFTFLGKGWEDYAGLMEHAGYEVKLIGFAPDYIDEIRKHDVQIAPICIGTGTKGKVLDALANGLLVVGSEYAMENIAVENGKSCVIYSNVREVPGLLYDISQDKEKYKMMANMGKEQVMKRHGRKTVSEELFGLFG